MQDTHTHNETNQTQESKQAKREYTADALRENRGVSVGGVRVLDYEEETRGSGGGGGGGWKEVFVETKNILQNLQELGELYDIIHIGNVAEDVGADDQVGLELLGVVLDEILSLVQPLGGLLVIEYYGYDVMSFSNHPASGGHAPEEAGLRTTTSSLLDTWLRSKDGQLVVLEKSWFLIVQRILKTKYPTAPPPPSRCTLDYWRRL